MVKISKNAKKILALTLAGVMTVGTVVPGSALSTVENVQAATVADEVLEIVKQAYLDLGISTETVVKGKTIEGKENIQELLKNAVKDQLSDEKYDGYEFTVEKSTKQILTAADAFYTITVNGNDSVEVGYPVEIIGSKEIADVLKNLDLSSVTVPSEMLNDEAVNKIVMIARKALNNSEYKAYSDDFNISATTGEDLDNENGLVPVTISVGNNIVSDITDIKDIYSISVKESTAEDSDEMKIVKNAVKEVTVAYTENNAGDVATAIQKAAEAALKAEGYPSNTVVAARTTSYANGKWTGTLNFNGGIQENFEVDVKVASITGLTLIPEEGKTITDIVNLDEIDYSSADGWTNALLDAMNIGKVRVDFDCMDSKTVDATDRTYFDVAGDYPGSGQGRIGKEYTVTITSKDPKTPADVKNITKKAVAVKVKNITAECGAKVAKVESADTSIADVAFDGKTVTLTAKKAGKVDVTVTDKEGNATKITYTINANGTITSTSEIVSTEVKIQNTVDRFGFKATKVAIDSFELDNYTDEGKKVVDVAIETVGTDSVVKISAVCDGEATIKVNGGLSGKLENTFKVYVKNGVVTVGTITPETYDLELNADAIRAIQSKSYTEGMKLTIADLGFNANCKIALTKGTVTDSILASDATKAEYKDGKVTVYYGETSCAPVAMAESNVKILDNLVEKLQLLPTSINGGVQTPINNQMVKAELTKDAAGNPIIKFTPGKDAEIKQTGSAVFTVKDINGNTATITVSVVDGKLNDIAYEAFDITKKGTGWKLDPETTRTYTIGEKIDLSGVKLVDKTGTKKYTLTEEMVPGFDTKTAKLNGTKFDTQSTAVVYGNVSEVVYKYNVKPQTATVSINSLGLASGETVTGVANKGDNTITSVLNGNNIEITAMAVDKTGAAVVTTSTGKTLSVQITVSEDGKISTEVVKNFKSTTATVDNTVETLGIKGSKATSANENVVLAKVQGDKITLTSVSAGSTTVTVTEGDKTATINVTVDEFGTISTSVNKYLENTPGWHAAENGGWYYVDQDGKIVENGWVDDNGVRYYIENGVTVYNTWKFFESEGVWRYFNKWGANVENGWYWVGKFCYFFRDGQMVENEWIKTNGIWSYVDKYGHALQNGWFKIDGYYYCFDKYGNMYADTYVGKYYVNKWGAWDSRYDKK